MVTGDWKDQRPHHQLPTCCYHSLEIAGSTQDRFAGPDFVPQDSGEVTRQEQNGTAGSATCNVEEAVETARQLVIEPGLETEHDPHLRGPQPVSDNGN
mmetsp:Transcript_37731/g.90621  ORF Transcript_37731/g.90621 Transcript_37731/m.90621 type:complete len:98 (+) Transcript_37731:282-575(+)